MAFKHRYEDGWYKNAAGLYVQMEPIDAALVAAASTGQVVAKQSDGTLGLTTVSGGGGGGGLASPDDPPASPNTEDDEFESSTLDAKWTETFVSGSPSTDVDTTWPSHYFVDLNSGTQEANLSESYAPAGDFSVTAKLVGAVNDSGKGMAIFVNDAGNTNGMRVQVDNSSGTRVRFISLDSGAFNQRGIISLGAAGVADTFYLHLQRVGTSFTGWYSINGRSFFSLGSFTKTLTVANIQLRFAGNGSPKIRMGVDWIRRDWQTL